ncbi:hypothetical protein [uncultured Bacteroides sp.]|uniref:hypothetical protein n=1 Tax=uncultured Bacteroides sp. TaxID=162156 RepID=UPI0025CF0926|nr:hypothetical protein [uncultured Bacteroides sp.]
MKKNFVRVMLFGALTLAVTTTVTSCKDNDDDIKNLQEQIDKITSTSPVSTEEMNAAVDKASKELKEQLAKLEKLVNDPSSETSLTQQIKDLESALETAVGKDAEDLAGKLVTAQTDLANLKKALGGDDYIKGLKKKIDDLESAKATMQALIDAEAAYKLDNKDLSGYKNTGFGAYVNQVILDATNGKGIAGYVDNAVKTGVGTVLKDVNEYLSANFEKNADLETFVKKVNETLFSETYKEKMAKLDNFLLAIDNAVKNGSDYASYEDVINQIDATKEQLASLELPSGEGVTFNSAVKAIVEAELRTVDSSITTLGEKLQKEIDAIKGMIQSIVYVPTYADGQVQFNTFYAKFGEENTGADWKPVVNVDEVKVKFRVSPAEVIADLVACFGEDGQKNENAKYDISVDCQEVQTRALNKPFEIKGIKAVGTAEPNLIEVTLDASAVEHSYAVALTVKDNVPADKKTLNDVSSNYFAAVKSDLYITEVVWTPKDQPTTLVKGQSIDYKTGGDYKLTVNTKMDTNNGTTSDTDDRTSPSEYGISTDLFSIAFSVSNETDFTLGETDAEKAKGVLAGKADGTAGNKAKVTSTVTVTNPNNEEETKSYDGTEYDEVTLVVEGAAQTVEIAADETPLWNVSPKAYALDATAGSTTARAVTAIKAALGNIPNFQNCEFEGVADGQKIMLEKGEGPNYDLVLNVPAKTICATADFTTRIISQDRSKSINVTVKNVTVSYPDAVTLLKSDVLWNAEKTKTTLVVKETVAGGAGKLQSISLERDLGTLFTNFKTLTDGISAGIYDDAIIYTPSKKGEAPVGTVSSNKFTISDLNKATNDVSVNMSLLCTGATGTTPATKTVVNEDIKFAPISEVLTSTFTAPEPANGETEITVKATGKSDAVKITTGFSWKDRRDKQMWPMPAAGLSDNFASSISTTAKALAIYGYSIKIEFVDNVGEYFKFTDGTNESVQLTEKGTDLLGVSSDLKVKVKITPKVTFGDVPSAPVIVTVVYPKALFN